MRAPIIVIENLFKEYHLGTIGHGTLRHDLQSWWSRLTGKEDPNSLVSVRHNSSAERDNILALNDISFAVKPGDVLGIIGRNGAGKSTLLKIIARITAPTKGQVKIKGRIGSLLEVGTGFHPELSGRENVYLNGAILGMTHREIERKLDAIINFSGIKRFIDTPVKRYSSGMYVRLAFSVAAHLDPEILIVDEVLAVGDVAFQKKCLGKMDDASKKEGRTILFVSHNMQAVRNLCPKAIWLEQGSLIQAGPSAQIIDNYLKKLAEETAPPQNDSAENYFEQPESDILHIHSVQVMSEYGIVSPNLTCDEPIIINVSCELKKSIPGMYGYLDVSTYAGQVLMVSDSREGAGDHLETLSPGKHLLTITIPRRILGFGDYRVRLHFADYQGNDILTPLGYVCSFHLDDMTSLRGNRRGSTLSTLLPWSITSYT